MAAEIPVERFPESSIHSIRCPNHAWDAARERARKEGVSMSYVIAQLVEGYAIGVFNMPQVVKQYEEPGRKTA